MNELKTNAKVKMQNAKVNAFDFAFCIPAFCIFPEPPPQPSPQGGGSQTGFYGGETCPENKNSGVKPSPSGRG